MSYIFITISYAHLAFLMKRILNMKKATGLCTVISYLFAIAACELVELPNIGEVSAEHHVSGNRMFAPWPEGMEEAVLGNELFLSILTPAGKVTNSCPL